MMTEIAIEATAKLAEDATLLLRSASKAQYGASVPRGLPRVGQWFVARDDAGQPIGTIGVRGALGVAEISGLWVKDTARRAGVGSRLLAAAEAAARSAGLQQLLARSYGFENPGFFKRHGYGQLSSLPMGEEALSIIWLVKPLQESSKAAAEMQPEEAGKAGGAAMAAPAAVAEPPAKAEPAPGPASGKPFRQGSAPPRAPSLRRSRMAG